MSNAGGPITLSVIIAAGPGRNALEPCLHSVTSQADEQTQIIVAGATDIPGELQQRYPWVTVLQLPSDRLTPHLWAAGLERATGWIVVLTTAAFVPESDWLLKIRAAHQSSEAAGIGGAILPPSDGRAADWAAYFLRYSAWMRVGKKRSVTDLAADNVSYRRSDLLALRSLYAQGFWEPNIHRRLIQDGRRLWFDPDIAVRQAGGLEAMTFCGQRFRHGRQFGRDRAQGHGILWRILRALIWPVVPVILISRIARRIWPQPPDRSRLIGSMIWLLLFSSAWALGEAWGGLMPPNDASLSQDDAKS